MEDNMKQACKHFKTFDQFKQFQERTLRKIYRLASFILLHGNR